MSRLGPWTPHTVEERLDRMESLAAIQQLAYRYGVAIDSRDMDMMVDLFVPDVRVGRDEQGREALKRWYTKTMRRSKATCHFVGNHVIDFDDADHARGIVYCHDELEQPGGAEWIQGQLQYWDMYRRVEGEWYFERRRFHRLYIVDWLTRPSHGAGNDGEALTTHQLPEAYPSWQAFWERAAETGT
ncbi:MAG: nuclear transport factor 2 family protein [Acidimicrobiaceae bacterium]|nr:nuclear transport factor 2 family protein [Acidimicrobiaceae bacterium]